MREYRRIIRVNVNENYNTTSLLFGDLTPDEYDKLVDLAFDREKDSITQAIYAYTYTDKEKHKEHDLLELFFN